MRWGPLPDIRFCPTGGINGDNAAAYLALAQCARGRRLLGRAATAIAAGDFAGITARARAAAALRR